MRKILCLIGWHKWEWLLSDVGYIDDKIPDKAKCKYCGEKYRKE